MSKRKADAAKQSANKDNMISINVKEAEKYTNCGICKNPMTQATTIAECLHSYCRPCIYRVASEPNSQCPTCGIDLGTHPRNQMKPDPTLQSIIFKLHPGLEELPRLPN